jgi:AcrR family transcriptional regulator
MADDGFQRARSPERKAERRAAILAAASELLDAGGTEAATLSAIAAGAGVVKSGLYRYFESREDILIHLLIEGTEDLLASMQAAAPQETAEAAAAVIAQGFAARPRLCLLISVMAPTLERNISLPALIALKTRMAALLGDAAAQTARIHPGLMPEAARMAIFTITALVAGMWPMANPGPLVAEAMARTAFADHGGAFEDTLRRAIHAILLGAEDAARA